MNNVASIPYWADLSNSTDVLGVSLTPPLPPTSSTSVKQQSSNNKIHNFAANANDVFMGTTSTSSSVPITPKIKSTEKKLSKQPILALSNKSLNNKNGDDSNNNINNNKNQRGAAKNNKKSDISIHNEPMNNEKKGKLKLHHTQNQWGLKTF